MYSGRVSSSCSIGGTRRVNLVTNPVISREWGKDREVLTKSGTYPWSFVTQLFHNGQPSHGGDCKIFEVMTSTLPKGIIAGIFMHIVTSKILSNTSLRVKLKFCEGQEKFEDIEIEGQTTQWSNEKEQKGKQ